MLEVGTELCPTKRVRHYVQGFLCVSWQKKKPKISVRHNWYHNGQLSLLTVNKFSLSASVHNPICFVICIDFSTRYVFLTARR